MFTWISVILMEMMKKEILGREKNMDLKIIYEDEQLIVCLKPAGVATQTKRLGQPDMESLLKTYRVRKGEVPYIGVVHRLDQPVAGVMVFAKTKEAAADLSRQVQTKAADKFYYAVTDGVPAEEKGTLEAYLLRDGKTNTSKAVKEDTSGAKKATLSYEVLAEDGEQAVLKIRLDTGRHHQIRVQLAHAGYPIVGDRKYNTNAAASSDGGLKLCSYKIGFMHPKTHKKLEFEIENPYIF